MVNVKQAWKLVEFTLFWTHWLGPPVHSIYPLESLLAENTSENYKENESFQKKQQLFQNKFIKVEKTRKNVALTLYDL